MAEKSYTVLLPDDYTIEELVEHLAKNNVKVLRWEYTGEVNDDTLDKDKVHLIPKNHSNHKTD